MSESKTNIVKAYLKPALWALFIFFLSAQESLPGFSTSTLDFIFKKSAHAFVYAVLYFLLFQAHQQTNGFKSNRQSYIVPVLISFLYALADELHQSTVPGRHPALRDTGFDMLGVATVLLYQLKMR